MITFIVTKDDVTKTIQFSTDGTLLDLKKEIIKQFDIKCDYIDIISNVEVPIRVMGKFNYDKYARIINNSELHKHIIEQERLKFYEQYEGYNASYTFNMDHKIKEIEKCYKYKCCCC